MNGSIITVFMSVAFAAVACGDEWYVDANNGNDGWDGTTAAIPTQEMIEAGGTVAGPRKTLHAMMSDERVVAGDTVWAAEGEYNEGGVPNGTKKTVNRVQVKPGVALRASGERTKTFIAGSGGAYAHGAYSNGAVRCVYFIGPPAEADYGYGIVKGFTLTNGRTCPNYKNDSDATVEEQGGASTGGGLLVDCILRGNGCYGSARGGTMYGGKALRCRFESTDRGCLAYGSSVLVDSLILEGAYLYSGPKTYNCTFVGNAYLRAGNSYNCLFAGTGTANKNQNNGDSRTGHNNTVSRREFNLDVCRTNGTCRTLTAQETPFSATTFRPLAGSVAVDAGSMSYYKDATNGWKAAWLAECGKDYFGADRVVNGTIDVGCGEAQSQGYANLAIADEDCGLVVDGANIGSAQISEGFPLTVAFSRNFTSERLCSGVEINGVFHSFGGTSNDVSCAIVLAGTFANDYEISAVYETDQKDWYASPDGNDANRGYHKDCPRKTLDKAMELAKENAGHVVHAAAGIYKEFSEGHTGSSRVVVKKGVGLVADEWPFAETVIEGAADTTSGEADMNGNGPDAVRCVYVNEGGYVKGFKLTGGRTAIGDGGNAPCGGGAFLSSGALIDCELTGNGCSYRGRAVGSVNGSGVCLRCHIHDQVCGSYEINNGTVVDSYVEASASYAYYGYGKILNSVMTGEGVRSNHTNLRILNTYLAKVSVSGSNHAYCTNCVFTLASKSAKGENTFHDEATCLFSVPVADNLDESFRPKSPESPLVDFGDRALYDVNFPSDWKGFKSGDIAGGQRVYNGRIDVGCGEYDFRPDFSRILGVRGGVAAMGPGVTTNAVAGIAVPEGENILLSLSPRTAGKTSGYELVYTPQGGTETVVSETTAEAFVRTLEGPCAVQSLKRFSGMVLHVR